MTPFRFPSACCPAPTSGTTIRVKTARPYFVRLFNLILVSPNYEAYNADAIKRAPANRKRLNSRVCVIAKGGTRDDIIYRSRHSRATTNAQLPGHGGWDHREHFQTGDDMMICRH